MKKEILERIDGSMGRVNVHDSSCTVGMSSAVVEADKTNTGSGESSDAEHACTMLRTGWWLRETRQAASLLEGRLGLNRIDLLIRLTQVLGRVRTRSMLVQCCEPVGGYGRRGKPRLYLRVAWD